MHYGFVIMNLWTGQYLTERERWSLSRLPAHRWTREQCRRWLKRYKAKHPKVPVKVARITIPYLLVVEV